MSVVMKPKKIETVSGPVYCPMCTHTVEARIINGGKRPVVEAGQRCPRCGSSLDAGYVFIFNQAA